MIDGWVRTIPLLLHSIVGHLSRCDNGLGEAHNELPALRIGPIRALDIIKLIPEEVVLKHQVIPINRTGSTLIVAMADPSNIFAIDDIKFLTGYNVEVVVASEEAVEGGV